SRSLVPVGPHFRFSCFFFFTLTATTDIYTLSLHDALPIYARGLLPGRRRGNRALQVLGRKDDRRRDRSLQGQRLGPPLRRRRFRDRKSTRLNSSHVSISYAVFCLKKKKNKRRQRQDT